MTGVTSKSTLAILVLLLLMLAALPATCSAVDLYTHEGGFTVKNQLSVDAVNEKQHYHLRSRIEKGNAYLANTVDIKLTQGAINSYSDKFIVGYKLASNLVLRLVNRWQPDEDDKNQTVNIHTAELTYLFQ